MLEEEDRLVATLKRIVDVWLVEDPEWVENGCADVCFALFNIGKKLGWPVSLVTGNSKFSDGEVLPHAWLLVDGKIFDPVAYASGYVVNEYAPSTGSDEDHIKAIGDVFGVETDELYGFDTDDAIKRLGLQQG